MDNKLFPERLDRNKVYECGIFSLYTDKVWMPIAEVKELLRNNRTKDGIAILEILFALQFYEY